MPCFSIDRSADLYFDDLHLQIIDINNSPKSIFIEFINPVGFLYHGFNHFWPLNILNWSFVWYRKVYYMVKMAYHMA